MNFSQCVNWRSRSDVLGQSPPMPQRPVSLQVRHSLKADVAGKVTSLRRLDARIVLTPRNGGIPDRPRPSVGVNRPLDTLTPTIFQRETPGYDNAAQRKRTDAH